MEKILVYAGDSFTFSAITDYEWLIKENIVDEKNIPFVNYLNYFFFYKKKDNSNSIYKVLNKKRIENSWVNRLSNILDIKYINLSVPGASWQTLVNQIIYSLSNIQNKEIIFIIGCPINERILLEIKDKKIINNSNFLKENNTSNSQDVLGLYDLEENELTDYLLNNHTYWNKKFSNYFDENIEKIINTFFTKKVFSHYNLHAIINIVNLIKEYKFFFLPTWYATVIDGFEEIIENKEVLENFILNKIPREQLYLKSPFILKEVKTTKYSFHPSFDSQKIIADYYYDFLKNKI